MLIIIFLSFSQYYNMWLSLFVAALCIVAMFLISWPVALITITIVMGFYMAVLYRHPGKIINLVSYNFK